MRQGDWSMLWDPTWAGLVIMLLGVGIGLFFAWRFGGAFRKQAEPRDA